MQRLTNSPLTHKRLGPATAAFGLRHSETVEDSDLRYASISKKFQKSIE